MNNKIHELTNANFDEVVRKAEKPVLIDFWAAWCGPCKMFAPVFEEVASTHSESMVFAKLDVDAAPELAGTYNIRSIPTLMVFKQGEPVFQQAGSLAKNQLIELIEKIKG
ncbi:MAG: thioredoxin [Methylacidiphilales bacterium]|nr:thioredoxin [Candidatus Methylacidiphilales bacterium]